MKRYLLLIAVIFLISGCATYKFQHGRKPYDKGYVVLRDDYTILEYSIGKDNSVPGIEVAKERFKRRRKVVDHYYTRMGYIRSRLTMTLWDPPIMFLKMMGGLFRLPFIATSEYRYEHNPEYRERMKKIGAEKDAREERRIKRLKTELDIYIQQDLIKEKSSPR